MTNVWYCVCLQQTLDRGIRVLRGVGRQFHDHLNVAIAVRLVHLDDKPPCGAVNDAMVVLAAWTQLPNDPELRFLISDIIRFHFMSPNNH